MWVKLDPLKTKHWDEIVTKPKEANENSKPIKVENLSVFNFLI
jgi:hypothetical protein